MMRLPVIAGLGLMLSACTAHSDGDRDFNVIDLTGREGNVCAADELQGLVGQSVDEIDTETLPQPRRIYGAGMAVTMDYRANRLNIVYDEARIVIEVKCG